MGPPVLAFPPLFAEALWLALLLAAPPAAAAMLAGAVTSAVADHLGARDPVLPSLPRIAAALGALALCGPWIADHAVRFGRLAFAAALGQGQGP